MSFGEMIKQMRKLTGLSYLESKDSLVMLVECVAARLDDGERREFAAKLPPRLEAIALSVYPMNANYDVVAHFMFYKGLSKASAIKQIAAAWQILSEVATDGMPERVRSNLGKISASIYPTFQLG